MQTILAIYEHSCIGFPEVKLKWIEERGRVTDTYLTVKGVIDASGWRWHNPCPTPFINFELARFDEWVRQRFAEDISVQG